MIACTLYLHVQVQHQLQQKAASLAESGPSNASSAETSAGCLTLTLHDKHITFSAAKVVCTAYSSFILQYIDCKYEYEYVWCSSMLQGPPEIALKPSSPWSWHESCSHLMLMKLLHPCSLLTKSSFRYSGLMFRANSTAGRHMLSWVGAIFMPHNHMSRCTNFRMCMD